MSFEVFTRFLSNEFIELGKRAVQAFAMPLETRTPNDIKHLEWDFYRLWHQIVIDHKIDHEHLYTYPSYDIGINDFNIWEREEKETTRALLIHKAWIEKAKAKFREEMKVYYSQLATEKEYLKHFPNPQWDEQKIINTSAERALLNPNINQDLLDKIFVQLVEAFHPEMKFGLAYNYIVKTQTMVGYSNKKECYHLLYKIDANNQQYHVYPIHEHEIKKYVIEFNNPAEEFLSYIHDMEDYVRRPDNILETKLL